MTTPVAVTKRTFEAEVLQAELPVLADFWAEWCAPCRLLAPTVDALAREYVGRLKVTKVDLAQRIESALKAGSAAARA